MAERYVKNGGCVVCDLEIAKTYYATNRQAVLAKLSDVYQKRQTVLVARSAAWRGRNVQKVRDSARRYALENPEKRAAIQRNRHARKMSADGTHTADEVADILRQQRGRCAWCKSLLRRKRSHVDHIEPLSKGGSNDRRNLQILCETCNTTKGAKPPLEFARQHGRLL